VASPARRTVLLPGLGALVLILGYVGFRFLAGRGGPPRDLSVAEAVDLACFQGFIAGGAPAYMPQPREVFAAELSPRDARAYLRRLGAPADWPSTGLNEYVGRTFVVVAHGTVTTGPDPSSAPRGEGFALVVDADGIVRLVAVGPPWNTAVPPGAQRLPPPDSPRLADVSQARARVELGGNALVELASPPGSLALWRITINPGQLPVDPSGTAYAGHSITLSYADSTGRPRLWLSEPTSRDAPRVLGRPVPLQPITDGVTPYTWYAGTWELVGFSWPRGSSLLFLTAGPGPDLPTRPRASRGPPARTGC